MNYLYNVGLGHTGDMLPVQDRVEHEHEHEGVEQSVHEDRGGTGAVAVEHLALGVAARVGAALRARGARQGDDQPWCEQEKQQGRHAHEVEQADASRGLGLKVFLARGQVMVHAELGRDLLDTSRRRHFR